MAGDQKWGASMKFFPKTVKRAKRAVGLEEIKQNTSFLKSLITSLVRIGKPSKEKSPEGVKTFAELGYTPEQLQKIKSALRKYVFFYLIAMGLSVLYLVDCLVHDLKTTAILVVCFFVFCAAQAFRNHFQYFQIQEGRLGCTFKEWRQALFSSRRKAK